MKLKLKVGSYYLNRDGDLIRIKDRDNDEEYPFNGNDDCGYSPSGKFFEYNESLFDLIKEVRVTIEEIEPVSEFDKLLHMVKGLTYKGSHATSLDMQDEIERLQKLFEGDNNDI